MFALSLLEPTRYAMRNALGKATGEIAVSLTPEGARRLKILGPQHVHVSEQALQPAILQLTSTQGHVFSVRGPPRIVIERRGAVEKRERGPVARISWRKPHLEGAPRPTTGLSASLS